MSKQITLRKQDAAGKDIFESMSKHEWRAKTRGVRATRQQLAATERPAPRAYRRAEPNIGKPGRKGRKARARAVRVLVRVFGSDWKIRL